MSRQYGPANGVLSTHDETPLPSPPPRRGENCQYVRATELAARLLFHAMPVPSVWATATVYTGLRRERIAQANPGVAV